MTDELGRELGAWLRTIDARPSDPATSLRRSMANVALTPQVSRSRLAAVLAREPIPSEPIRVPSIHHSGQIGQDRPVHVTTRGTSRVFITATAMAVTTAVVLAGTLLLSGMVEGPTNPPIGASPAPATESPSVVPDTQPVMATARDNGVRVSMAWEEPLTAGEPTYLRTTVTNTRDTPIWWLWGKSGLAVQAFMPGLERRVGEPVVPLDFGDPDTLVIDLKNNLTDFGKHLRTRLALPLELDEVQGLRRPGGGDVGLPPERLRPGGTLEFVHRWDGSLEFEQDQPGDVGLPPSGPVEATGAASYALEPDGKVRSTEARLETSVVGGWDEQHLDPLEVVDAVMADPESAALLADADLSRYDTGIILFDTDEGVWYVGTCGRSSTDDPVHWRLAKVDPVGGEVLGLIDGLGTKSCDAGTWPGDE